MTMRWVGIFNSNEIYKSHFQADFFESGNKWLSPDDRKKFEFCYLNMVFLISPQTRRRRGKEKKGRRRGKKEN